MSETSLNIEMADLGGVKIVCTHCHASIELPVARLQGDAPERCFHCLASTNMSSLPSRSTQTVYGILARWCSDSMNDRTPGTAASLAVSFGTCWLA